MIKNKADVVLIRPYSDFDALTVPLGLLYLASYIKDVANVKIIDGVVEKIDIEEIKRFNPSYVGITATNSDYTKLFKLIKEIKSNLKTTLVVGGPYVTCSKNVDDKDMDIIIKGEGEIVFKKILMDNIKKGVFVGIPLLEQDLNDCFPSWELINLEKYFADRPFGNMSKSKRYISISTSRGCPYGCIYCAADLMNGKKWRARTPEGILNEIKYLYKKYKINEFHIIDDAFNLDIKRAEKLFDLIIESGLKIHISFPNGIRADHITNNLLKKMKKAGVYKISYGIESASPKIQKLIKKNLSLDKVKEAIDLTVKNKIIPHGFFMIGFPTETEDDYRKTVDFAKNSNLCFASFHRVLSFEGTALYDMTQHSATDSDFKGSNVNYSEIKDLGKKISKAKKEFYFSLKRAYIIFRLVPFRNIILNVKKLVKKKYENCFL